MKQFFWVIITLLLVCSFCLAEVNQGINTKRVYKSFTIDSAATDTTVVINLSRWAEQGWPTVFIRLDSAKTLDAWISSTSAFQGNILTYSDSMQCVFNETVAARVTTKPADLALIRSLALADTSDRSLGFLPGCDLWKFRISLTTPAGDNIHGVVILRFK